MPSSSSRCGVPEHASTRPASRFARSKNQAKAQRPLKVQMKKGGPARSSSGWGIKITNGRSAAFPGYRLITGSSCNMVCVPSCRFASIVLFLVLRENKNHKKQKSPGRVSVVDADGTPRGLNLYLVSPMASVGRGPELLHCSTACLGHNAAIRRCPLIAFQDHTCSEPAQTTHPAQLHAERGRAVVQSEIWRLVFGSNGTLKASCAALEAARRWRHTWRFGMSPPREELCPSSSLGGLASTSRE